MDSQKLALLFVFLVGLALSDTPSDRPPITSLGPFRTRSLPSDLVIRSTAEDKYEIVHAPHHVECLFAETPGKESRTGRLSAWHSLTLGEEDRETLNIPKNTSSYAWAYGITQSLSVRKMDIYLNFIKSGGFAYRDSAGKILKINVLMSGGVDLEFLGPYDLTQDCIKAFSPDSHPVSSLKLQRSGAKSYVFLSPNQKACKLNVPATNGGFAYIYKNQSQSRYFIVRNHSKSSYLDKILWAARSWYSGHDGAIFESDTAPSTDYVRKPDDKGKKKGGGGARTTRMFYHMIAEGIMFIYPLVGGIFIMIFSIIIKRHYFTLLIFVPLLFIYILLWDSPAYGRDWYHNQLKQLHKDCVVPGRQACKGLCKTCYHTDVKPTETCVECCKWSTKCSQGRHEVRMQARNTRPLTGLGAYVFDFVRSIGAPPRNKTCAEWLDSATHSNEFVNGAVKSFYTIWFITAWIAPTTIIGLSGKYRRVVTRGLDDFQAYATRNVRTADKNKNK